MTLATVGDILFVAGSVVFAVGAFGLARMPDFYARLSSLTMSGGLAIVLILAGLLAHFPSWGNALLVLLAIVVQLTTSAVGGGAMARAAYLVDAERSPATYWDELAEAELPEDPEPGTR